MKKFSKRSIPALLIALTLLLTSQTALTASAASDSRSGSGTITVEPSYHDKYTNSASSFANKKFTVLGIEDAYNISIGKGPSIKLSKMPAEGEILVGVNATNCKANVVDFMNKVKFTYTYSRAKTTIDMNDLALERYQKYKGTNSDVYFLRYRPSDKPTVKAPEITVKNCSYTVTLKVLNPALNAKVRFKDNNNIYKDLTDQPADQTLLTFDKNEGFNKVWFTYKYIGKWESGIPFNEKHAVTVKYGDDQTAYGTIATKNYTYSSKGIIFKTDMLEDSVRKPDLSAYDKSFTYEGKPFCGMELVNGHLNIYLDKKAYKYYNDAYCNMTNSWGFSAKEGVLKAIMLGEGYYFLQRMNKALGTKYTVLPLTENDSVTLYTGCKKIYDKSDSEKEEYRVSTATSVRMGDFDYCYYIMIDGNHGLGFGKYKELGGTQWCKVSTDGANRYFTGTRVVLDKGTASVLNNMVKNGEIATDFVFEEGMILTETRTSTAKNYYELGAELFNVEKSLACSWSFKDPNAKTAKDYANTVVSSTADKYTNLTYTPKDAHVQKTPSKKAPQYLTMQQLIAAIKKAFSN